MAYGAGRGRSKYTIEVSTVDGRDKLPEISRTGTMPNICIQEPGRLLLKTSFSSDIISVGPSCHQG